jgi:F-type H+-transporting ATPase subunit a
MLIVLSLVFIARIYLSYTKNIGKLQNFFETVLVAIEEQVKNMGNVDVSFAFPFIVSIFLFVISCNLLSIIPYFNSPTSSLSTTIALVVMVIIIGITYGIKRKGVIGYFKKYVKPTPILLPINMISDVSSTCSMAIRLYGNMMSGMIVAAIVSKIAFLSFGFPVFLSALSFISSIIQAYIFSILTLVFMMSVDE